jgi:hypothetical protein
MRRAGIALAVMVTVGSVGGLAAVASAEGKSNNGDPGYVDNCTKFDHGHGELGQGRVCQLS